MRKRSFTKLNRALGLLPLNRQDSLLRHARASVEEALSIESKISSRFGGNNHSGPGNPLLTEMPLPSGWRKCYAGLEDH